MYVCEILIWEKFEVLFSFNLMTFYKSVFYSNSGYFLSLKIVNRYITLLSFSLMGLQ